jgi:hypothetical protein
MLYQSFGGEMMKIVTKCIGMLGGSCVTQRMKGAWGLGTSILST